MFTRRRSENYPVGIGCFSVVGGELESEGRKVSRDRAERLATKAARLLNLVRYSSKVEGRTLLDETEWVVAMVNNDCVVDITGADYTMRWELHKNELSENGDHPDYLVGQRILQAHNFYYDGHLHPKKIKY